MATLETLLSQQMVERLGWTLIHFVWQAATVALLLAVALRCLRRSSSNVRYVVSCLALVLIVALPLVTMSLVEVSRPVAEAGPILKPPPVDAIPVEVIELADLRSEPLNAPIPETPERVTRMPWTQRIATMLEPALPWLVLGWLLGVFGLSTWHLGGWAQLQRMKRRLVSEVAAPLHARAAELAGRLGIRRAIGLWASPLIDVPAVVGWIKPVILLPVGAVTGLSVEQLEAILAHELAHVRRCDYLINLIQTVVEILGFYHPAVWWISHRIRDERENCCDDLAVQVCGDSRRYARALTCLEELRHVAKASRPRVTEERARARCPRHTAVAASGGSLVDRIARLLGRPPIDNRRFAWLPGLIALLVVAAILIPTALVLAAPDAPDPEPVSEAAPPEVVTQTLPKEQAAETPKVLVNFLLFTNPMPNKIVDSETRRRIGEVLAPEIPQAREGVASMQNCTLVQILQTWLAGRLLTPHSMEVLVDVLQSQGYLEGEATPEILVNDNQPGQMGIITEKLTLPATDPASPPKSIELGTFVKVTSHVPPAPSDRITLEIAVEWKNRIEQPNPNDDPMTRSTEIASTVTILRDRYFALLAEPDGTSNSQAASNDFHLVIFRADVFEPSLAYAATAAAPAPAGKSLSRQVILDIQTVSIEKGRLVDGIAEWAWPQGGQESVGIQMGYTPDKTSTDALQMHLADLYAQGAARRLAHQRLTTQEGYKARFKAVKEEWFSLAAAPAGNAADPRPDHTSIASGTIITATPTIGDANDITLDLDIEFSESLPKGEGADLPIVTRRTSRNVVTVRDGGTVLLAGLSCPYPDPTAEITTLVTARLAPEIESRVQQNRSLPQTPPPPEPPTVRVLAPSAPEQMQTQPTAFRKKEDTTKSPPIHVLLDCRTVFVFGDKVMDSETAASVRTMLGQKAARAKSGAGRDMTAALFFATQIAGRALPATAALQATQVLYEHEYVELMCNPQALAQRGRRAEMDILVEEWIFLPHPPRFPGLRKKIWDAHPDTRLGITPQVADDDSVLLEIVVEQADVAGSDSSTTEKKPVQRHVVTLRGQCFTIPIPVPTSAELPGSLYVIIEPRVIRPEPRTAASPPRATAEPPDSSTSLRGRRASESEPSGLRTVTATFKGAHLRAALETVAEMAGANIMYDANLPGEVYATLDDVSIEAALQIILTGSPYVFRKTNYGYEVKMRDAPSVETSSREMDTVEVAARFVLVDRECMEALRRGLPIQGATASADVNALHEIGSGLAEGRTPLLKPDRVELLLRAVQQYAASKSLAAPKVTVRDGESASVHLSSTIGYVSGYREPNDASPEPIAQHASKEVGVRLDATPQIIEDQNDIRLQFEMEITSLLATQKALYQGKHEYDIPTFTTATTATEIVIPDGQTALIHVGEAPAVGNILSDESELAGPLLLLIKPSRTTAQPPDPAPPMQRERRPGDPGMGGLPPDIALP